MLLNAVEGKSTDYASSQVAVRSRECLASRLAREEGPRSTGDPRGGRMTPTAPGEVVGQFYEEFGAGELDAALAFCDDGLEIVDPGMGQVQGRQCFREYSFRSSRARAIVVHTNVFSGELQVAVEGRFVGTHTAPLATDHGDVHARSVG